MANMLDEAVDYYDTVRQEHLGETVAYSRSGTTKSLVATVGSTRFEAQSESGLTVRAKTTDFIFKASELVIGGLTIDPLVGDQVRVTRGTKVLVYEVQNVGDGGCWRPCDSVGTLIRVHARQIDQEVAP